MIEVGDGKCGRNITKQERKEAKAEQMDTGLMRNKFFSLYISLHGWIFLLREEVRCRVNS